MNDIALILLIILIEAMLLAYDGHVAAADDGDADEDEDERQVDDDEVQHRAAAVGASSCGPVNYRHNRCKLYHLPTSSSSASSSYRIV